MTSFLLPIKVIVVLFLGLIFLVNTSLSIADTQNVSTDNFSELNTINIRLKNLPNSFNVASSSDKQLGYISGLIKRRSKLMESVAKENPEYFLQNVIPESVRNILPEMIKKEVEQKIILKTVIGVVHDDDFDDQKKSVFYYFIKHGGRSIPLYIAGPKLNLVSGDEVTLNGYLLGNTFVVDKNNLSFVTKAKPDSVGNQKILFIPITSTQISNKKVYSKNQLQQMIFKGPFQDYFKEQSYNKVSFSGLVTDWLSIYSDNLSNVCSTNITVEHPTIVAYLKNNNINLADYSRVVYIFSTAYGGCASVGKWPISVGGVDLNISQSWVGTNEYVKGTYKLYANEVVIPNEYNSTYEEYAFTHCRIYSENNPGTNVRCTWNTRDIFNSKNPTNWQNGLSYFSYVLAHEIGHNLGVMHANALYCDNNNYSEDCHHVEYGNYYDVMGTGLYKQISPARELRGGHFNSFYKNYLGWYGVSDVITAGISGKYSLSSLEQATGTKMIILSNPLLPTESLYVEYRQPIGFDWFLSSSSVGLFINESIQANTSRLLNANQTKTSSFNQPALMPGNIFNDVTRGISVESVSKMGVNNIFNAKFSNPVCLNTTFDISMSPYSNSYFTVGTDSYLSFGIENKNSVSCPDRNLMVTVQTITDKNWSDWEVYYELPTVIKSGDRLEMSAASKIPKSVTVGNHKVKVTITDVKTNYTSSNTFDITVLEPIIINKILPLSIRSGDKATISGSGFAPQISSNEKNNLQMIIHDGDGIFVDVVPNSNTQLSVVIPQICKNGKSASNCASSELINIPSGKYYISLINNETRSESNYYVIDISNSTTTALYDINGLNVKPTGFAFFSTSTYSLTAVEYTKSYLTLLKQSLQGILNTLLELSTN